MKLLIINQSDFRVPRVFVHRWLDAMVDQMRKCRVRRVSELKKELTLAFITDKQMKVLNREFRGKDKTTDILSFEPIEVDSMGELIVSGPQVRQQAREHGLSQKHELGYLLIHGVLHLLGYDHEDDITNAEEMFKIQDEIFEKLRASV